MVGIVFNLSVLNSLKFRPGHSTKLAALRMVDHIIKQMGDGKLPLCIYETRRK